MKRHPSLREFSDDHHGGLVNARRLRRAASGEEEHPEEVARAFLEFWREDTAPHFRKEEEVLLPVAVVHAAGLLGHEPVAEMLLQHARIRGLAMRLGDEVDGRSIEKETLRELGEQLEVHIRLEERVVFPLIEGTLPEQALREVADRLGNFEDQERLRPASRESRE